MRARGHDCSALTSKESQSKGQSEEMSLYSFPPQRSPPAALSAPKRRFGKLGRRTTDGGFQHVGHNGCTLREGLYLVQDPSTAQSGSSDESAGTRQPCKSRLRNHSNRLSAVFLRGPSSTSGSMASSIKTSLSIQTRKASTISTSTIAEDPSELSNHVTAPGVLKIFGSEICQGAHYKSVLATTQSSAKELVKEALERYGLNKEEADSFVLCDAIGSIGARQWKTEAFRVVGDNEKPLLLQSLWKPREGLARRFEIQKRSCVEERASLEKDTVTAGINAQARKLQKSRSRVTSTLTERSSGRSKLWRSKSSTDMLDCDADKSPTHQSHNSLQIFELPKTSSEQKHIEARSEEGRAQDSGARTEALCDLGARGEREAGEWEREETESSGDGSAQYSIHPPHDCPYLLLLKGHSHTQDFIIYLLASTNITVGQTCDLNQEPKVDVVLSAGDILPTHCYFHRHQNGLPTTLRPSPNAMVTRNGEPLTTDVMLLPGDIIGLGHSYLFMFKEPAGVSPQDFFTAEPWLLAHTPTTSDELILCNTCLSTATSHTRPPCFKSPDGHKLTVHFSTQTLDIVTREIVAMGPRGTDSTDRPPLTVAFLLSTCIQYCATSLQASQLRRLLLLTASHLQSNVWELTKDLAAVQPEDLKPQELKSLNLKAVISGLRPLVVWMSNSLELLHFIQFQLPVLLDWRSNKEQGHLEGTEHNLVSQIYLSCVRSATEETVAVLEEVIMLAFQQCVYYVTKVLYPLLPAVLDCNPFRSSLNTPEPTDGSSVVEAFCVPEEVQHVVEVLNQTWRLLKDGQLHPEISAQLVGYLFYFINASLFNSLMERGSEAGFYQWSRGVHLRASLDLILDWAHEKGLGEVALEQSLKLSCALNLLATPRKTLHKTCWASLRSLYPALHPAQLHHLLSLYRPLSQPRSMWSPSAQDQAAALHACDVLESFDTHHPLVLPDDGYHLHLDTPVAEGGLRQQLDELRHFICNICESNEQQISPKAQLSSDSNTPPPSPSAAAAEYYNNFNSCGALLLSQKLQHLELQDQQDDSETVTRPAAGSSCLLTPPNTPHTPHQNQLKDYEKNPWTSDGDIPTEGVSVCTGLAVLKVDGSSLNKALVQLKEEEEQDQGHDNNNEDEVFSLDLERGERGIGLALVDTWEDTAVQVKGLFIRAVLPDSPAALSEKLAPGDRILAVNGVSLLGLDYQGGKELIQASGDRVTLLVTKALHTHY